MDQVLALALEQPLPQTSEAAQPPLTPIAPQTGEAPTAHQ
jgi:hypothetical protein